MKRALAALLLAASPAWATDYGAFLSGQVAANDGKLDYAAARLQQALAADPGSELLQKDAFVISLLAGRPEAAALAAKLRDNPIAALLTADDAARRGDWRAAELGYAELPKGTLTDALRPLLLAWAQQAQGQTDRALLTLAAGGTDTRLAPYYTLHAALIADIGHRDGEAERLYRQVAGDVSASNLRMAQLLASWQARSGHAAQARATIQTLLANDPELAICRGALLTSIGAPIVATARQGIAEAYAGVASGLRDQHASEVPDLLLQLASLMQPEMTESRLIRAEMAAREGHYATAAEALRSVPADDPLCAILRLRLADYLARGGQSAQAEAVLRKLAQDYPDRSEPLLQLGEVLADAHHYTDAVTAYDRAVALVPQPGADDWFLFYARGAAEDRARQWARAEADMRTALRLHPDQPSVLNFLGFSWTEQNRNLGEAKQMIQRALEQRPDDGAITDSLGWVLLRQGEVHEAVRQLERATELAPDDATVNGHLGDAYWQAGRKTEAEDQWRRAMVLKPDPDEATRISARLREAAAAR